MIENLGIGIDLVAINRFRKIKFADKPSFYKKLFHSSEIKYCLQYKDAAEHFAGKFAIKEAIKKSIKKQVSFLDIKISYSNSKPIVKLLDDKLGNYVFLVSVSHEKEFAIAVVVSEKL